MTVTILIVLFIGIIALRLISVLISDAVDDDDIVEKRKNQTESKIRERMNSGIEGRMKASKKRKLELLFKQAGVVISIGDYLMLSFLNGFILAVAIGVIMKNILLIVLFFFIGFLLPKQVIVLIRNKRLTLFEKQIGSFMNMLIERYITTNNIPEALSLIEPEFTTQEPIHSEIVQTISSIDAGFTIEESLKELAVRTGNVYMELLSDGYGIGKEVGKSDSIVKNFKEVYKQYNEDRTNKHILRTSINKPKNEAFITLLSVPAFTMYQITTNPDFIRIMTTSLLGQVVTAVVATVMVFSFWFINSKIGAPIK